jgi:hypothetical protein
MPRGPKGEKRPADVIGTAVHVMRIATGKSRTRLRRSAAPTKRPSRKFQTVALPKEVEEKVVELGLLRGRC